MKTRFVAAMAALVFCGFAAAPKPEVEKAVLAAEKAYVDAIVKADRAALEKLLGDDLTYTHSSSKTETKADVLQVIASGSTKYVSVDFQETKVRQYGSTAVVTHKAVIKTVQSGVANLYVTHVWAKQKGGWQMVARQATRLPQ